MLNDSHADARFNAATALASHGKAEALPVLLEMIEPDQSAIMQDERPEARQFKQVLVNINGLRGIVRLADMNPAIDLTRARAGIEELAKSKLPEVRDNALAAQEKLSSLRCENTLTDYLHKLRTGDENMAASKAEVIELLTAAYSMELETVLSYLAHSTNLDGVRAEEIKKSLAADITEELSHATQLAQRIKQIGGLVPGSTGVKFGNQMQPVTDTTDVIGVIEAVIKAEEAACRQYKKIIKATEGEDYVTQDMCITLLGDEEEHLVLFKGFLKEYKKS